MKRVHLAYPLDEGAQSPKPQVACSVIPAGQKWERTTDHSKVTCINCRCTNFFKDTEPKK